MVLTGILWDGPIQPKTGTVQLRNRGSRVRILPGAPLFHRITKRLLGFSRGQFFCPEKAFTSQLLHIGFSEIHESLFWRPFPRASSKVSAAARSGRGMMAE